jgi:hypothetical protein
LVTGLGVSRSIHKCKTFLDGNLCNESEKVSNVNERKRIIQEEYEVEMR